MGRTNQMKPAQGPPVMIERTPVDSTNLKSIGYDPKTKTLAVEFRSGAVYEYYKVLKIEYDALMSAKETFGSIGSYFNAAIAHNQKYPYKRVVEPGTDQRPTRKK